MFSRRRAWWFVLLAVIAIALIIHQVFTAIPSPAQNPQTKTFDNLSIGGLRLDRCLTWEHKCGAPAAKAFCQSQGYSKLVNSGIDNSPTITKVIGDGRICQERVNHPNCDGFKFITCSNNLGNNTPSHTDKPLQGFPILEPPPITEIRPLLEEPIRPTEQLRPLKEPTTLELENILRNAQRTPKQSNRVNNYQKQGGFEQANKDFDSLRLRDIKDKGGGIRVGKFPDGRVANVRPKSTSTGEPTLEVYNPNNETSIKIRYSP